MELHAPVALSPVKELRVPTGLGTGWAPEQVYTLCRRGTQAQIEISEPPDFLHNFLLSYLTVCYQGKQHLNNYLQCLYLIYMLKAKMRFFVYLRTISWNGQLRSPAALTPRKRLQFPLDNSLVGLLFLSERDNENKNHLTLFWIKPRSSIRISLLWRVELWYCNEFYRQCDREVNLMHYG